MAKPAKTGLVDLERELTCSICTEVLYQPLTLLDCLHTFCGSCLKEWFSWQVSQASTSKPNPFTCPSCRASVRETRPNAGITTLLDMYLQANPSKGKDEQEKEEMKKRYTPGENVLPRIKRRKEHNDEVEDRRMVEEVREMSLRELGIRGSGSYERGVRHRVRDRASDSQEGHSRGQSEDLARPSTTTDAVSQARQIGHQSSLRSLLSSSDVDSSEMEEEILRQIMEEGILDGIDLNNIDVSQEDELSERIADAYRRRYGQRTRAMNARAESSDPGTTQEHRSVQERQRRRPGRSPNPADQNQNSSHPPVSRPHLLEAYPVDQGHRRRTSSETRQHTSPVSGRRASSEIQRPAARSATDLSSGSNVPSGRRVHLQDLSSSGRRVTDPENLQSRGDSHSTGAQSSRSPGSRPPNPQANSQSIAVNSMSSSNIPRLSTPASASNGPRSSPREQAQTLETAADPPEFYPEPSISCDRCGKSDIQYELHWNCSQCHDGHYNLCLRCYRSGRGCLHWLGFGYAASQRYRTQEPDGYPPHYAPPHHLEGHCYVRPPLNSLQSMRPSVRSGSTSDPKARLQSGPFCSNCLNYTPECYWRCDVCNEGEWGFCNRCVNQSRCCTHALLPLTYLKFQAFLDSSHPQSPQRPLLKINGNSSTSLAQPHIADATYREHYTPLTFSSKCDICTYPIPPSTTRFHCLQCNAGDYDIDVTCYHKLVHKGKITTENGPKGWRRCLNGHRMIIVGFEDSSVGQRRIIVEDLVGGHALKDDESADGRAEWTWREGQLRQVKTVSKASTGRMNPMTDSPLTPPLLKTYPPNGGVGIHILALWSWWPQEGANDELAFPKGAEIRECEDINGDWFWGIYCARKGLFPSDYGRVVGNIV